GSGKTTTMNLITGLYPSDSGRIILDDKALTGLEPPRIAALGVARTFQNIRLLADQTVLANVMLGTHRTHRQTLLAVLLRLPGVGAEESELEMRCRVLLDELRIGHLVDIAAGDLSYG